MAYRYDENRRADIEYDFDHDFTDAEWAQVLALVDNAEVRDGSEWIYSVCSVLGLDAEYYL